MRKHEISPRMIPQRPKMINGLLLLAVLGCTSIQAFKTNLPVEIIPDKQVAVRLGQSQTILCKAAVALQVCRFQIPGEGSLVLAQGQKPEDGIEYFGEGLESGQCGVTISMIREKHDGNVTCYLTPGKGRTESYNSVLMVVARPPINPILHLDKNGPYKNGEKMEISCIAAEGRPPANVSIFLEDEPIGQEERSIYSARPLIGENLSWLNTSRVVYPADHGKTLRCSASHIALDRPLEVTRQIEVHFPPQPQKTIERFGYAIGRPGKVTVTVHVNPIDTFVWKVGDVKIPAGQADSTNRFQASSPLDQGHGFWSLELKIETVQKSDTEKEYSLEAHNSEGYAIYKIVLSSSSEPPAGVDLDAGSIIGIVVGVLVLILAVFLVVFARATGRWCFAARRRNDEEAAGGAGAGSEAHITPGSDEDDDQHEHEQHIISDEKLPASQQHGQENPIHASTEYVNGRNDINNSKDIKKDLDKKTDTPV